MERTLWQPERLTEFGPNPFLPDGTPLIQEVHGARPRTLKAAVQAKCENVPGVYGMLDDRGVLIYVGKSKRLRARLLSYFSPKVKNQKPGRLIRQSRSILWEPAPNEFAALLRELQLIQYWQPRFNVKDIPHRVRSTFICLGRPTAPGVLLGSKPAPNVLATFGPIWGGRLMSRAVEVLNRLFSLRDCPNSQPMGFSDQSKLFAGEERPGCLRFEMQTCLGPCISACSTEAYFQKVDEAREFLEGSNETPFTILNDRMERCSSNRQYETAARLRDDLIALCHMRDRLARVREAQERYHFVYQVMSEAGESLWYLIRGGRVAAVTKPPADSRQSQAVRELVKQVFSAGPNADDLVSKRPDTLLLVTSWFQQKPDELEQTLSPREAKSWCQPRRRPK